MTDSVSSSALSVSQDGAASSDIHASVIANVHQAERLKQRSVSIDVGAVATGNVRDSGLESTRLVAAAPGQSFSDAMAAAYSHERKYSHPTLPTHTIGSCFDHNRPLHTAEGAADMQPSASAASSVTATHVLQQQQTAAATHILHGHGGLQHTPNSSDACASIVHSLMCHRKLTRPRVSSARSNQGNDDAFSRRAIESLIKKLKDKRDELDALIQSVTTGGAVHTKCVTIQRTLDGRLQVAGRKGFPHVVYARIWRWPDLHKNELKHLKFCQFAFDLKLDLVCVNPFHYERVMSPGIGNLDLSTLCAVDGPIKTDFSGAVEGPTGSHGAGHSQAQMSPRIGDSISQERKPRENIVHPSQGQLHPLAMPLDESMGNQSAWPSQILPGSAETAFQRAAGLNAGQGHQVQTGFYGSANPLNSSYNPNNMIQLMRYLQLHDMIVNDDCDSTLVSSQPQPEFWCDISYHEFRTQIGDTFKVSKNHPQVTVDCVDNSSSTSNRFCLRPLANPDRADKTDKIRHMIGPGIVLSLLSDGDVYLKVESEHGVYVESFYLDREAGRSPGECVHQIYPCGRIKVFDLQLCYKQMHQHASNVQSAASAKEAALASHTGTTTTVNISNTDAASSNVVISADEIRRFGVFRVSFAKGWGPDFPKRPPVSDSPCWLEVRVNHALQLVDQVLQSVLRNNAQN